MKHVFRLLLVCGICVAGPTVHGQETEEDVICFDMDLWDCNELVIPTVGCALTQCIVDNGQVVCPLPAQRFTPLFPNNLFAMGKIGNAPGSTIEKEDRPPKTCAVLRVCHCDEIPEGGDCDFRDKQHSVDIPVWIPNLAAPACPTEPYLGGTL